MDFKDRILTTLNHEEPDRVPVMGLIMDRTTSNRALGKEPLDIATMMTDPALRGQAVEMVNTGWHDLIYESFADAMEASIRLGFDANWTIFIAMEVMEDPEARTGLVWHDIYGRLWELIPDEHGNVELSYVRGLLTTEEAWDAWVERKAPQVEAFIGQAAAFHRKLVETYGERAMPMGYAAPGIFENAWQPMGFENFVRHVRKKPAFIKRVIDYHTDLYLRHMDAVLASGLEVVVGGDDLGQKTGPLMRPSVIEDLLGESYRRVSERVHGAGRKLLWHCCGNIYELLDRFVAWGFDGTITLEPTAGMDLGRVREQVGHDLVLVGNLDVSHLLVEGSREEVEEAVKKAIGDAAEGGGYILAPSHSHAAVDPTRLAWMVEAAHRYGGYPISSCRPAGGR